MDTHIGGIADGFADGFNLVFRISGRFEGGPALRDEQLDTGDDHAGQADDEIGLAFHRQHQGDGAAFAVADHAHLVEAFPQQLDAGEGVVLEVEGGGLHHISRRSSHAAVVAAERGDSGPREGIGNDCKGLVFKDFLVAILLPAAGDHDEDGRLARVTFRQHEGSGQFGLAVGEGDLLFGVREGPDRSLRPVQFLFRSQGQGERQAPLLERAQNLFARPETFIGGHQGRNLDGDAPDGRPFDLDGYTLRRLVRRIQGRFVSIQVEHDGEGGALDIQFPRPVPRLGVR